MNDTIHHPKLPDKNGNLMLFDIVTTKPPFSLARGGETHTSEDVRQYDQERDELLKSCGLQILHFSNHQVLHNTQTTLTQIQHVLSLPLPPGKGKAGRGSSPESQPC